MGQRLSKKWEKASVKDIIKDIDNVNFKIKKDDYAYQDKNGRWRAGRLSKKNTGQFVSGASARSSRGRATQLQRRIYKARQFNRQRNLSPKESWKKAGEWKKEYAKAKRQMPELTNLSSWVDEQYSLETS